MSKSKGNVILPEPLLDDFGADAIRLFAAGAAKPGENIKTDEDQIEGWAKFLQKLWNIARFVSMFPTPKKSDTKLREVDEWILAELNHLLEKVHESYENYNFYVVNDVRDFTWNTFASNYLEMVKPRAYGSVGDEAEQKGSWWTLSTVLKTLLKMLAPIAVFVTDYIYEELFDEEIHLTRLPQPKPYSQEKIRMTELIKGVNSAVWKWKKEQGRNLKSEVETLQLPTKLAPIKEDLKSLHKAKKITLGKELRIEEERMNLPTES